MPNEGDRDDQRDRHDGVLVPIEAIGALECHTGSTSQEPKVSRAVFRIEERMSRRYSRRPARRRASPSSAFLSGLAKRADRIAIETVRDGSSSSTRSVTTLASSLWPRLASAAACKT